MRSNFIPTDKMYSYAFIIWLYCLTVVAEGQHRLCDQTPPRVTVPPSENKGVFTLLRETKESLNTYLPDQTYVLILKTNNNTRPFKRFMITAEDPGESNKTEGFETAVRDVDVGSLKTLDTDKNSRYSERCFSSVENADNSDKYQIEVHWVSPKQSDVSQRIRIRAMVAENEEVWYSGDQYLTIELEKNDNKPLDSPPWPPITVCNLCSEARYEVIFEGKWSRLSHPKHYPTKPDDNGYSYMIGASHDIDFILWKQGQPATVGLQRLAEDGDIQLIQRDIIDKISADGGTRTLIRGRRRHHPHMHEPSHSLFRTDRIHHLFSIVVSMRPSPDWFLGTSQFELCSDDGWLEHSEIPLYPWDAGTVDGISYESPKTMSNPQVSIERVAVGSFDSKSPFYQMNLNDLKPFAKLKVNRLDVYPLEEIDCGPNVLTKTVGNTETNENNDSDAAGNGGGGVDSNNDSQIQAMESRMKEEETPSHSETPDYSYNAEDRSHWSPCEPLDGICGPGLQTRVTQQYYIEGTSSDVDSENIVELKELNTCAQQEAIPKTQDCYVNCA